MLSMRLKRVCVFINNDVFANALCDVIEIVLVLQWCGIVLKWWLGTVQLGMSSITVNLDPEFYYLYTCIRLALIIFIQLHGHLEMHEKNSHACFGYLLHRDELSCTYWIGMLASAKML